MNVDVIIVGLGPTGATLAALLGQRGVRVAAFDRLPDLYPLPRAIGLDHEVMRIMQELGIAEKIQKHTAPYRPSEYRGMEGQLIKRLDMAPPPYRLGWAPNYVFDQPAFEGIIRTRLSELATVQVHLETEVTAQGQDAGGAWIDVRVRGEEPTTRATGRYLVACDGGASPIRTRLGIPLEDLHFHEPWLVVDVLVNEDKLDNLPQTQVQYCEAGRPSTFVVLPGNHRRWEIMLLPGESLSPEFPESELWPLLERWIRPEDGKLWRAAAYRFHGLLASRWREGRILLAGDAAHMTPPFMAQGMVQGLRDAQNLAWKLDRVLSGSSPASLLDSYGEERRPHVVETTLTAIELGRVICERDPELARRRDERLLAEQGGQVRTVFRQNMIPPLRHGLIALDAPGAGSLVPQPRVRASGLEGRLDDLCGRGVRVMVLGELDAAVETQLLGLLASCGGTLIQVGSTKQTRTPSLHVEELEAVMAPWLASLGQSVVIARPDNYVYGTAQTPAEAIPLLQRLLQSLTT
ncbi:bifunctional 3-(3-hydroxy-phenyl)propionate/3-hydroxycinnamic acid hydroxylase [Variovorax sp. NFACC27]|uniref:bifunctional 3-(3-hydroxy-phenyl)propionate/3-hydroxycinnamic acid hydroxylase n=1 Tax=unclassified Variovorax TaxID=663243 RepID=UPI0008972E47|nr:3-(3-hydroxy-phenyl)propionate hydroxylase [Variovorax sp. NFACC28]SEG98120.1 3-(3-hydroxy-phenyl)propionate hydroxylase [Variovorax sp. NFACC29]SFE04751.1 3-(3-hydroxy-phenyl)propionate hydroxylase [Variovorax sp. NFACC26]SFH12879.1 3-(3-hydroxy-phenyl)propionate hydroxylase [Variovorax sp. NFACC27]